MTAFKAVVSLVAFGALTAFQKSLHGTDFPPLASFLSFFMSGFLGMNLCDILLLHAFSTIGPARSLMIFSFQPIFMGILGYIVFAQSLSMNKCFAILFMIGCVFVVSYERFRKERRWEIQGPLFAFAGMLLDTVGILFTRYGFETNPQAGIFEGNFYRACGALAGFLLFSPFLKLRLWKSFQKFSHSSRFLIVGASLLGTLVAASFHVAAVSRGNLAIVAAINGTGPVFAAIVDSIAFRRWPSPFLYLAFALFAFGFYILL